MATAHGVNSYAKGDRSSAIGLNTLASGDNSSAIGTGANASGNNSIALGANSKASEDNSVSVGNDALKRKVTNVADGVSGNDAVNKNQLDNMGKNSNTYADNVGKSANTHADNVGKSANIYTDNAINNMRGDLQRNMDSRFNEQDKKIERGLASTAALSGLFQPYGVGKFNLTAGVGGYTSESALAIGSGYRFDESVAIKAGVSTSTSNTSAIMYNTSVNYEW